MKTTNFTLGIIFLICLRVHSGIPDYLIYDTKNRYKLEECEAIATIKILNYYAFADVGLVQTFTETRRNTKWEAGKEGYSTSIRKSEGGSEVIYDSFPQVNAQLQLRRNSLWILEAEVTKRISGLMETNRIFVAMKPTSALMHKELPYNLLQMSLDSEIVVGLVKLRKCEFENSFRGLVCYLYNDISFLDLSYAENHKTNSLPTNKYYSAVFRDCMPSPCFVVREIGVNYTLVAEKGVLRKQQVDSKLIKKLKAKDKK